MAKKLFNVDLKRDGDALAIGAAAAFVLMVLPGISGFLFTNVVTPIRDRIAGIFGSFKG